MLGCLRRASLNIGGSTHPTLSCVDQDRLWIMDITSRHMMLLLLSRFIPRVTLPHGVTQVKLLHNELCLGLLERNSKSPYLVISENTSPLSLWEDTGRECPEIENCERPDVVSESPTVPHSLGNPLPQEESVRPRMFRMSSSSLQSPSLSRNPGSEGRPWCSFLFKLSF